MIEPNNDHVICPSCAHEFGAVSVNDQARLRSLEETNQQLQAHLDRVLQRETELARVHRDLSDAHRELAKAHAALKSTVVVDPQPPVVDGGTFTAQEGDLGIDFDGVSKCVRPDCTIQAGHRHITQADAQAIQAIEDRLDGKTTTIELVQQLERAYRSDESPIGSELSTSDETINTPGKAEQER